MLSRVEFITNAALTNPKTDEAAFKDFHKTAGEETCDYFQKKR
jgi:hypothetical protein